MEIDKTFEYRIAFLGSAKVGKTAILNQLVYGRFQEAYEPTVETDLQYVAQYMNKSFACFMIDTCGSDDFPVMRKMTIKTCNGFIVVFSFDNLFSLKRAKDTIQQIKRIKRDTEKAFVILVGNRKEKMPHGSFQELTRFCDDISDDSITCRFIKVSATDHDDVINMFNLLLSLFPRDEQHFGKRRNSVKKQHRLSSVSLDGEEIEHEYEISLQRSPSLLSLKNFSGEKDLDKFNYATLGL